MSQKRPHSPPSSTLNTQLSRSNPIEDRASIFVAHYSPSLTPKALQSHPDFRAATHKIVAWRRPSAQRAITPGAPKILETGYDDDGEKYAGKRLEKVLTDMGVEGSVVVARWYGGIMLGPVRFTHIETCARDAIRSWKGSAGIGAGVEEEERELKRKKILVDNEERDRLVKDLGERDESIDVLRGLLSEKAKKDDGDKNVGEEVKSPKRKIEYARMPLVALRKLDKARDATIAFLLKEIDKAEAGKVAMPVEKDQSIQQEDVDAQKKVEGNGEEHTNPAARNGQETSGP